MVHVPRKTFDETMKSLTIVEIKGNKDLAFWRSRLKPEA